MSTTQSLYQQWATHPYFEETTRTELASIANDDAQIADRFGSSRTSGTAGFRGILGPGTNRMNRYVVRHATQGLANYIKASIAHDSRLHSTDFAKEAALTLNANGIPAFLWGDLRPTPMLSFAVRHLGATAGIVITASHNPKEYNGYKVYWSDGGQVTPDRTTQIQNQIQAITASHPMAEDEARATHLLNIVPNAVDRSYYDQVAQLITTEKPHREACRMV